MAKTSFLHSKRSVLAQSAGLLIRILINTALGAVLIYFWLKLVNLEEIFKALKSFNMLILIPASALQASSGILKALRFKTLLSKAVNVPAKKMVLLTFVSQLLSFTIPIRAGEIAKGVYLSTEYNLHFGKAVIWVFLDRFLDFWVVLALSLVFLLIVPTSLPQTMVTTLFAAVAVASLAVVIIVLKPAYFYHLAKFLSHFLIIKVLKAKFLKLCFFIIDCFVLLKGSAARNFLLFFLTAAATFAEGLCWYLIFASYIPGIPILKVWLGSLLTSLTFMIPAAPGYVGSAEAAGLAVFSFGLGLTRAIVPAVTVIFHAISLVYILSTGIFALYFLKFNLKLVWKKLRNK